MGFSKGGVCLNHFIAEVATLNDLKRSSGNVEHVLDWEDEKGWSNIPSYISPVPGYITRSKASTNGLHDCLDTLSHFLCNEVSDIIWLDSHRFPTSSSAVASFAR